MLVRRTAVLAALSFFVWVGLSLPCAEVRAQLAAGRHALEQADFQRAIRAFDRAERTETLDRDGLVSLYEGRVIARFAVGTRSRARRDLQILAELDPAHSFPVEVPPEVGEALAAAVSEAGGGLAAPITWSDEPTGSHLRVDVLRDVASLVARARVHSRVGDGAWSTTDAREVSIAHAPGEVVAVYVELLGAHDVVLAREGSEAEPVLHGAPPPPDLSIVTSVEPSGEREPLDTHGGGDDGLALGLGLGLGGAALVAAVVLGVVLGTQTSDRTQPSAPIVVGF